MPDDFGQSAEEVLGDRSQPVDVMDVPVELGDDDQRIFAELLREQLQVPAVARGQRLVIREVPLDLGRQLGTEQRLQVDAPATQLVEAGHDRSAYRHRALEQAAV